MSIKKFYASAAEVPEALRDLYVEGSNGQMVLDVEDGFKSEQDVEAIKKALQAERDAHKRAKADNKEIMDIKAQLEQLVTATTPQEKKDTKVDVPLEVKALQAAMAEQKSMLDTIQAERDALAKERKATAISTALTGVAKGKIADTALSDLLLYQSQFDVLENGDVVTKETGDGVATWFDSIIDQKPHWKPSNVPSGAKGGSNLSTSLSKSESELNAILAKDTITPVDLARSEELQAIIATEKQQ